MKTEAKFIVVQVGCLECAVPHHFVGAYGTHVEAFNEACRLGESSGSDQDWIVFQMPDALGTLPEPTEEIGPPVSAAANSESSD